MTKLVSVRVNSLREKLRQFEHGGHCFGSDDIAGLVRELRDIGITAAALEDQVAGQRRQRSHGQIPHFPVPPQRPPLEPRPQPGPMQPGALQLGSVPLGRIVFVPNEA